MVSRSDEKGSQNRGVLMSFWQVYMGEPQKDGKDCQKRIWLVVWNIFYFSTYWA
jgi:hypothetical protein